MKRLIWEKWYLNKHLIFRLIKFLPGLDNRRWNLYLDETTDKMKRHRFEKRDEEQLIFTDGQSYLISSFPFPETSRAKLENNLSLVAPPQEFKRSCNMMKVTLVLPGRTYASKIRQILQQPPRILIIHQTNSKEITGRSLNNTLTNNPFANPLIETFKHEIDRGQGANPDSDAVRRRNFYVPTLLGGAGRCDATRAASFAEHTPRFHSLAALFLVRAYVFLRVAPTPAKRKGWKRERWERRKENEKGKRNKRGRSFRFASEKERKKEGEGESQSACASALSSPVCARCQYYTTNTLK